ncbi:hypothetical protein GBA52_007659 [Prunus armeniaca]|nr:hypothetical protein GBA52_007659 [Prunus armeniaca]
MFGSLACHGIWGYKINVDVTKDDYPVIFQDNFIGGEDKGVFKERRVTDITLLELLSYGPQKEAGKKRMTPYASYCRKL